jgi:hypothetical protein
VRLPSGWLLGPQLFWPPDEAFHSGRLCATGCAKQRERLTASSSSELSVLPGMLWCVTNDVQQFWDAQASRFDEEPDHGLLDPDVRAAWSEVLLPELPPAPGRVADLGCGTGEYHGAAGASGLRRARCGPV